MNTVVFAVKRVDKPLKVATQEMSPKKDSV
jgi:hypothetical protein